MRAALIGRVVVLVAGVMGIVPGVSFGAGWSVVPSPNPPGPSNGALSGVSCTAPAACTAVGMSTNGAGPPFGVTLAERWDGTRWRIEPTPAPSAVRSELSSVSCGSAAACTAVGSYTNGSGVQFVLAEGWNGSRWTIQPTPALAGDYLSSVSCVSATTCMAVGQSNGSVLAEAWNGTRWTIVPTPASVFVNAGLSGVSCTAATACTAVGYTGNRLLAARWNGKTWAIQPTLNPAKTQASSFSSVSCSSVAACTAVGSSNPDSGGYLTLAEGWNGKRWAIEPIPSPAETPLPIPSGISCASANACTAVGPESSDANGQVTWAERWNGARWAIQSTPTPSGGAGSVLSGVSCTAAACIAVGQHAYVQDPAPATSAALAERWNSAGWAIQATPDPVGPSASSLAGVSCAAATACSAVGTATSNVRTAVGMTLVERWTGKRWSIQSTLTPTSSQNELAGVSCSAVAACTAVGYAVDPFFSFGPLAEGWSGAGWAGEKPAPVSDSLLLGVSCASPSACTGVGYQNGGGGGGNLLAERWDGTKWTSQSLPIPSGEPYGEFYGVSCTSVSACTAVGSAFDGQGTGITLAERWNGTSWTIQPTPSPAGARFSNLSAISCTSASACTAVGLAYHGSGTDTTTLAEHYDGTSWTIQPTPTPAGAPANSLSGVSCASTAACTAVGRYTTSAGVQASLAERWNGTSWAIVPTPRPPGAHGSVLSGVSCTAASACTAVGDYDTIAPTITKTLVEVYR